MFATLLVAQVGRLFIEATLSASVGFWFRLLPLVAYALLARRVSIRFKIGASFFYLALTSAMLAAERTLGSALISLAGCWLFIGTAALAVYGISHLTARIPITIGALAVLFAALYLAIPALMLRNDALGFLLTVGFDRAFAAVSYCSERRHWPKQGRFVDCLHFMIVDPTLVYPARSRDLGIARVSSVAALRVGLGIAALVAQGCYGRLLPHFALAFGQRPLWDGAVAGYLSATLVVWANLMLQYIGHSGVTSVQIGALAMLGWNAPERYHYPLFARSPADLWRRWNIYMGLWLQRYVFLPLAVRWQRAAPRPRDVGKSCAVIATFALCGFAHELVGYALALRAPAGAILGFTACGACIVMWLAIARVSTMFAQRHPLFARRGFAPVAMLASMTASGVVLAVFGWLALPGLAGGGMPLTLMSRLLP